MNGVLPRARLGQALVVIGTRSAVFLPLPHPGLIVLDEEHETTFKQETAPRYHARDVAIERSRAEGVPLVLGSGQFIPGFEEQLVGVSAGDEKDVEVSFPEEYGAEHLAGKAAVFSCTIKEVKAPVPAPIDDSLAERFGMENLDALKAQVRERLLTQRILAQVELELAGFVLDVAELGLAVLPPRHQPARDAHLNRRGT